MPAEALRVLFVEDSADDAQLVQRELNRGGFAVTSTRVETAPELTRALTDGQWDLVIADHDLPHFNAPDALRLVRHDHPDLPFIIVSGAIGEDVAVEAMRAGAADYLVKGRLARLVPAVRRELTEAADRRRRKQAEQALEQTERQLRQAQKMEAVGRLAGGVAHDFNNLLTAILGYTEIVLQDMPPDAPSRADLEEVKKAGERATTLTRQLLAFSRLQVLDSRVADFNAIVGDVEKMLRRMIGADIELVTELDSTIGRVKVDAGQMEQVLMNLVVNARDAMPHGGRLVVRTCDRVLAEPYRTPGITIPPGRYVLVAVADTGTGMTAEILKRVFEPFFTTKAVGEGTGLGLSTVYGIVKQSGGCVTVSSEPGRGSEFDIYLPCVDEPLDVLRPSESSIANVGGTETILLVDDDEGIVELLGRALREKGYTVLQARDGVQAMLVADRCEGAIHALVTDLVMPRMGGAELAELLATQRPGIRVLFISGYMDRVDWKLGAAQPDCAYLQKPFAPRVLVHKVRELIDAAATDAAV